VKSGNFLFSIRTVSISIFRVFFLFCSKVVKKERRKRIKGSQGLQNGQKMEMEMAELLGSPWGLPSRANRRKRIAHGNLLGDRDHTPEL